MHASEIKGSTILIIDDRPADLDGLVALLESHQIKVIIFECAVEGIAKARSICPDLILLDVLIWDMDSFEICRQFKVDEQSNYIPIIFMTELLTVESKIEGFEAGAVDYLTKPLQLDEVWARIKTHLTLSKLQRQLEQKNRQLEEREYWLKESQRVGQLGSYNLNNITGTWTGTDVLETIFGIGPSYQKNINTWLEIVHPEQRTEMLEHFQSILANKTTFDKEYRIIRRSDNQERWVHGRGELIFDDNGIPIQMIGTVQDITERKQAEKVLFQIKEAAEAANRAKSAFLANMSHELRTPINSILGFSQLLARDALSSKQKDYLDIICNSGEHLLTLVNDVLEMSKIEAGRSSVQETKMDLFRMLGILEDTMQLRAENKGLELRFEFMDGIPRYLKTDEAKLRQVLANLIDNAVKFTPQGRIIVRISKDSCQSKSSSIVSLLFEVEDTGLGIEPDEIDHIFEPFIQGKNGKGIQDGTGLGLSICRQFVKLMNGDITVGNRPGGGTIFTFHIEAETCEAVSEKIQSYRRVVGLENESPEGGPFRLVVVDDNFENRISLRKLLEHVGFSVREAIDGKQAVECCEQFRPHLMWMDLNIPLLSGYEAASQIKRKYKEKAPVIIALSANVFGNEDLEAQAKGCDDFVHKPFHEEIIFETMAKHLDIRYRYKETGKRGTEFSEEQILDSVKSLSWDTRKKISESVELGDIKILSELLVELRKENPVLSAILDQLIRDFAYAEILELLHKF